MRYLARALAVVGAAAVLIVPMAIALNSQPVPLPVTPSPTSAASPTPSATPDALPSLVPSPIPTASPESTAAPLAPGYVQREGLAFAIIDNPVADTLFISLDTCLNEEDGYRLSFPASWYTNTQIGQVPPCTWFAPKDFMVPTLLAVRPEFQPPDGVVIIVMGFEGGYGYLYPPTFTTDEVISVAGYEGWRREHIGECGLPEGCRSLPPRYEYEVILGSEGEAIGPTLLATTSSEGEADYELNKAVLDRIMASLEFLP